VVTVLGVDPGLTRCGVGVVAGSPSSMTAVAHDCVRTRADTPLELRLLALHDRVAQLIATHRPDVLAIERVLFQTNVRTAMATGQAAGVAMLAGARAGIPVVAYSPNEVKLAVTGDGAADKDGVARMVVAQLRLDAPPRPVDVTDALAVAITHLARSRTAVPRLPGAGTVGSPPATGTWEALIAGNPHLRVAGGTDGPADETGVRR
jgi:crossover junction endodeoxyribonuclease RuvC